MISAINNNNPSFTSVIPIRVFLDDMEVFSPVFTRPATRQLTSVLAGPAKGDEKKLAIIRKFAQHDPDYDYTQGYYGFKGGCNKKKSQPSDFFRCIVDTTGTFLFTGLQAKKLIEIGKNLGKAQQTCKNKGGQASYELQQIKSNYGFNIMNFLRSSKLRITEAFDRETKQRTGEKVSLNLHLTSNKKYGEKAFKMSLNDISFSKVEP